MVVRVKSRVKDTRQTFPIASIDIYNQNLKGACYMQMKHATSNNNYELRTLSIRGIDTFLKFILRKP